MPAGYLGAMSNPVRSVSIGLLVPREHGGWILALEPVALGLLAAPSVGGLWLVPVAAAALLARRPLQVAAGRFGPELRIEAFAQLLVLIGLLGALLVGVGVSHGWAPLLPLLGAAPLAAVFLSFDLRGEARKLPAELAGAAAFALVPVSCARLAGLDWPAAQALGGLAVARAVPALLVVRTCLRRAKGHPEPVWPVLAAQLLALGGVVALWRGGLVGGGAPAAVALLMAVALWLLRPGAPAWRARRLGVFQAVLGVGFVLAAGLGGLR